MRIDRIIGKAKQLGLITGDNNKSNELLNIAYALDLVDNGKYDLDDIENTLDAMLEEQEESPLQHRNAMNEAIDREALKASSKARTQSKIDNAMAKMESMGAEENQDEEVVDNKEEGKEAPQNIVKTKLKDESKNVGKKVGQAFLKAGKGIIAFIASHPLVFLILGVIIVLIIVLMVYFASDTNFSDGYFDQACDYNLARVNYDCGANSAYVSIKDFVIGSVYAYSKEYELSVGAIKALMIAIKTNTLAAGHYSSTNKVVDATCSVSYESVPSEEKAVLEKYYDSIERYLYLSDSYEGPITSLSGVDTLNIGPDYIEKIAHSTSGNYKTILKEVYGGSESSTSQNNVPKLDTSKETIYIGDSRMNGMVNYGIVDKDHAVYHGANGYCWFRYNTNYGTSCSVRWYSYATNDSSALGAINLANQKMKDNESYNIVIWLGVNDAEYLDRYFAVYKSLAEGEWHNHTIYIAEVGPVNESLYTATYYRTNEQVIEFNNNMASLIGSAGLDNLVYLDLGLTQDSINWNGTDGVHYGKSDYQMIYNLFQTARGLSGKKSLYDLGDYCEFHKGANNNGCESGWWWPIGESGTFKKGDILTGDAEIVSVGAGLDYGWRFHPVLKVWRSHTGEDLEASMGRNVIAPKSGTVTVAIDGYVDNTGTGGCGNQIVIDHGNGFSTRFCHLKQGSVTQYVTQGMSVSQGQIIGLSGNTGTSTGPHLHFEVLINGTPDNPLNYISVTNPRPKSEGCVYESDKAGICRALKDLGLSDEAAAGILTNIAAEGMYKTNNLEDCYEQSRCCKINGRNYGYCVWGSYIGEYGSDEAYTNAVSNGTYQNFAIDHAGYGLIQWTDPGRKAQLLEYYENLKASGQTNSIADPKVQIGFMIYEINNSYSSLRNLLSTSNSAYDIALSFCTDYERPAGSCYTRASNANSLLNYVKNNCS